MIGKYLSDLKREFSGYNGKKLAQDVMAGLTVASVALPLALAFGVSSGADAAAGLVTAIFAGLIIGMMSGASYQISGPTGAMSAILIGISAKYGIQGVLIAGFLSGALLVLCSVLKVGGLVSFMPAPVITGFTSGIAIIIALGQLDHFFGTTSAGEGVLNRLSSYAQLGFSPNWQAVMFGGVVVAVMLLYPKKLAAVVPSSLAGIIVALGINLVLYPDAAGSAVAEVGAIPRALMTGNSLLNGHVDWSKAIELIRPAVSIAALGMIESLLCGASAGRMKGEKLDARRELMAQGIGNMLIPLFGGVPATAAIARTSVAIKSGGQTRLVSVVHSITLVLSMFLLGGVMSRIPLAALAGVLMVTAWRMNEWSAIRRIFSSKMKHAIFAYLITMMATVLFDLTIAIVIGVAFAMAAFVVKSCKLGVEVQDAEQSGAKLIRISGPLFFGTQEKLGRVLDHMDGAGTLILCLDEVPSMDASAAAALAELMEQLDMRGIALEIRGARPDVAASMDRAGISSISALEPEC